jgi:hypothetical protein
MIFKRRYLAPISLFRGAISTIISCADTCPLLVEGECAQLVRQSSGRPAVLINFNNRDYFSIWLAAKINTGYMIGMIAGAINIILKVAVVIKGHEHFPHRPYLYIFQSLVVIYFCYIAYKGMASL